MPERATTVAAPSVEPQMLESLYVAAGDTWPPSTIGTRFCRTAVTAGVILTSVPHAPTFTRPSR